MSMQIVDILLHPLVLAAIGYGALVAMLALAVQPLRIELVETVEDLLSEDRWTDEQKGAFDMLAKSCMSYRANMHMLLISLSIVPLTLAEALPEGDETDSQWMGDPRFSHVMDRYVASVLAVNPLASVFTVTFMVAGAALLIMRERKPHLVLSEAAAKTGASMVMMFRRYA